jgi:hypothetical protein
MSAKETRDQIEAALEGLEGDKTGARKFMFEQDAARRAAAQERDEARAERDTLRKEITALRLREAEGRERLAALQRQLAGERAQHEQLRRRFDASQKRMPKWQKAGWVNEGTSLLFEYLIDKDRGREYVEEGSAAVLSGKIRLQDSNYVPPEKMSDPSQNLLCFTATRLNHSFGEDGNCYHDLKAWPDWCAYGIGLCVHYHQVADRLLRKYVPEYVPSEAVFPGANPGEEEEGQNG